MTHQLRVEEMIGQGRREFQSGDLEAAVRSFDGALAAARGLGDIELIDRAFCSRCGVLVELERVRGEVPELQRILVRSQTPKTRWMAAYYIAIAYDLDAERDRAKLFARRALDLAPSVGEHEVEAATSNLCGNLALAASDFQTAVVDYETALGLYDGLELGNPLMAAQVRDNLGYALMCCERVTEGVSLCEQSRDAMRECGALHFLHQPLQDLCYGYLLLDRVDEAREHGEEGLVLGLQVDDRLVVKNLLYLLAEASVRAGDRFRARRFLRELASYFPEIGPSDEIIELLMAVDLTQAVNLRG